MTIEYNYKGLKGSASGHIALTERSLRRYTSQAKPGGYPTQNIPDHPLLIQLIVVQYLKGRVDNRVGEDRTLGPLGKYLGGVCRRGSPYRKEE